MFNYVQQFVNKVIQPNSRGAQEFTFKLSFQPDSQFMVAP